jgi:hypothetical protein
MLTILLDFLKDHSYLDISQVLIETQGYAIGIELKLKLFDIYADVHRHGIAHFFELDTLKSFARFNIFIGQSDDVLNSLSVRGGIPGGDIDTNGNVPNPPAGPEESSSLHSSGTVRNAPSSSSISGNSTRLGLRGGAVYQQVPNSPILDAASETWANARTPSR